MIRLRVLERFWIRLLVGICYCVILVVFLSVRVLAVLGAIRVAIPCDVSLQLGLFCLLGCVSSEASSLPSSSSSTHPAYTQYRVHSSTSRILRIYKNSRIFTNFKRKKNEFLFLHSRVLTHQSRLKDVYKVQTETSVICLSSSFRN